MNPVALLRHVVPVTVVALLAFGCGAKNRFEKELEREATAVALARQAREGGYDLVTTEELKKLVDDKADFILVDTMPFEDSYRKNHIPGAVQFLFPIPAMKEWNTDETDGKGPEDYEKLLGPDKAKLVVVYCGFVRCARSHNAAVWARNLGYTNVKRHPGGIFAWKGAGYPTEAAR